MDARIFPRAENDTTPAVGTTTSTTTTDDRPTSGSETSTTSTSTTTSTSSTSSTTITTTSSSDPPETSPTSTTSTTSPPPPTSTTSTSTIPTTTTSERTPTLPVNTTPSTTTTPAPPIVSPSPSPSPPASTSSVTTITTSLNNQLTTFTSPLPTSLSSSMPSTKAHNRDAIIAGATTAGILSLLVVLGAVFLYRRDQIRRQFDAYFHRPKRENRGLLDGEDFDDEDEGVPMQHYRDSSAGAPRSITPHSAAPSLDRQRVSGTSSIFREEVWPPPGQFVDPFLSGVQRSQNIELTNIVDDVMGTKATVPGPMDSTVGSGSGTGYSGLPIAHTRPASGDIDPFRDGPQSATSVLSPLPPGASPALTPGASSNTSTLEAVPAPAKFSDSTQTTRLAHHLQPAFDSHQGPPPILLNPSAGIAQPKTSSPLAGSSTLALNNANIGKTDSKLWLGRKVRASPEISPERRNV